MTKSIYEFRDKFGILTDGEWVQLVSNKITEIPDDIDTLTNARRLRISAKITKLPDSLCNMNWLEELELEECRKLESLPEELGLLKNLRCLLLKDNGFKELPESIGDLVSLQYLALDGYKGKVLPAAIGKLENLVAIYAVDCRTAKYQFSVAGMRSLRSMVVEGEKSGLKDVPADLASAPALEFLGLEGKMMTLPEGLGMHPTLKGIQVASAKLEKLPSDVVQWPFETWIQSCCDHSIGGQSGIVLDDRLIASLDPELRESLGGRLKSW